MKAIATLFVVETRDLAREVVGPPLRVVTGIIRAMIPNARSEQV